jgi:hypothetical protein
LAIGLFAELAGISDTLGRVRGDRRRGDFLALRASWTPFPVLGCTFQQKRYL